jgi:hypothetical protein
MQKLSDYLDRMISQDDKRSFEQSLGNRFRDKEEMDHFGEVWHCEAMSVVGSAARELVSF